MYVCVYVYRHVCMFKSGNISFNFHMDLLTILWTVWDAYTLL